MVKLRTDRAPAFFGEHVWETVDDVVEVTAEEAHTLLGIVDAEFHEVTSDSPKPSKRKTQVTEPDPDTAPSAKRK